MFLVSSSYPQNDELDLCILGYRILHVPSLAYCNLCSFCSNDLERADSELMLM